MSFSSDDYPDRFEFREAQPRLYARWEQAGYFHSEPDPNRQPYTIVIPPPNVTGALHLGHALNSSLQDIMIRLKRMQGFNALWMPGTDHAGIATQAVVERRLKADEGKTRHDLGREQLVARIWEWKEEYEKRILSQLKQLGASCDWERVRFTLDERCAKAVRQTFFDLFNKELIYRGKRLVNWDTALQTAVSDDEVYHEAVKGKFWHIRYRVLDRQAGEPEFVTIATTRPETLLGDTAVAVHPDPARAFEKVLADLAARLEKAPGKEKPELQAQIEAVEERRAMALPQLEQLRDMAAAGRMLELPLLQRPIPLVADRWAKPEMGSGCVKITPAHDPNDYLVGVRQQLPMLNILNPDGTLNANAGPYQGLTMPAGRKKVVADLEAAELLAEVEDREIELAHSDRSKAPIEPYLADQWFVKMDSLAESAMTAVTDERVKIFPPRYAKAYLDWLGEKRDWCISRNLWWGHQIAVWSKVCADQEAYDAAKKEAESHPAIAAGEASWQAALADDRKEENAVAWGYVHVCIREENSPHEAAFEALGYVREEDVLDTWFSSALWPHSTLGWPDQTPELAYYYPTSVLMTSRDIISLWVARMVLAGLNNMGEVPFHEVFIHPKILDGAGEGMSKSKGNGVDPLDVIEKFGADSLRFGLAYLTTDNQDVKMPVQFECPHCETLIDQTKKNRELPRIRCTSKDCGKDFATQWARTDEDKAMPRGAVVSDRFERGRNFANKLWNAARFALLNLSDFTPGPVADSDLLLEDRWLLSRLATVTQQTTAALEGYHFAEAVRAIYDFAWDEYCSFYIEMAKSRLAEEADPAVRQVAQRVLAQGLDVLLRLLHPVMPFITEEIWSMFAKAAPSRGLPEPAEAAESIMLASWPTADLSQRDEQIEAQFATFQQALGALREIRARQNIQPRQELEFFVRCDAPTAALLETMSPYFESMAKASIAGLGADVQPPALAGTASQAGMDIFVDLKNFIDVDAERTRLEKEVARITGFMAGKKSKLSNASFVDRAPADVVAREREQLEQLEQQLATIKASLEALGNL
ncbi:valine--tRNA ligase [Lignipirellula cremea]|uniref:Valine--tRNA ligase n=1 Tax=Lignipirellula cremea TaxID=2528010 RepID=A0A518E4Z8_9BACT|nr:valine--tRNA ligase [Lignipirellula cremea]QDU99157.1 Valine--tRNA ligase [Lignipirellula cremea]